MKQYKILTAFLTRKAKESGCEAYLDILSLINELESENEKLRLERDVLIGKKIVEKQKHDKALIVKIDIQKQLKNRIAELESENENLKINLHETENLSFQINQMNGNLILVNQRLHTELKKYKKALELIGKQYMSDMGMGKSIEDDIEYYEINLRNIIQTAIKQAGQEEQK